MRSHYFREGKPRASDGEWHHISVSLVLVWFSHQAAAPRGQGRDNHDCSAEKHKGGSGTEVLFPRP